MILNGKNVCDGKNGTCRTCFTCGMPKRTLIKNGLVKELCPKCYAEESKTI